MNKKILFMITLFSSSLFFTSSQEDKSLPRPGSCAPLTSTEVDQVFNKSTLQKDIEKGAVSKIIKIKDAINQFHVDKFTQTEWSIVTASTVLHYKMLLCDKYRYEAILFNMTSDFHNKVGDAASCDKTFRGQAESLLLLRVKAAEQLLLHFT